MTCEQVAGLVTDYLDGALTDTARVQFEEHIAQCPMCEVHLERMRRLIRELGALRQRD
jgi:anti-sigma factor RsiW